MTTGQSDLELVARVTEDRDHAAFETLFNTYFKQLHRHILSRFHCSVPDAEDAAQYAFMVLWRGSSLTGHSVMPLLCAYADNYLVSEWRKRKNVWFISLTPDPSSDKPPLELRAAQQQPENPMLDQLPQALEALPETFSTAIRLRYLEEKSTEEAAQIIGRDQSTVSRRAAKGLRKLKFILTTSSGPARERSYRACVSVDERITAMSKRIERLRAQGTTWRAIARLIGVSEGEIYYRAKKRPASVGLGAKQRREV